MTSKNVKLLSIHLSLLGILFAFNNCGPIGETQALSENSMPVGSETISNAADKNLPGNGLTVNLAPGCTPSVFNDFIEKEPLDVRRIEPRECSLVKLATPILSWSQTTDRDSSKNFVINLTRSNSAFNVTYFTSAPRLLINNPLSAGTYHWFVKYINTSGQEITSQTRQFVIPTGSFLQIPTGAALTNLVLNKAHPRALPKNSNFSHIAALASSGEYKQSFAGFLKAADAYLNAPISTVPANLSLADFNNDQLKFDAWKLTLRNQSRNEVAAIENLGYAFYFTGNLKYQTSALNRLAALAKWPPNGATSEAVQDQANREIYLALGLGLDLFQAQLSQPAFLSIRNDIISSLKNRLLQVNFAGFNRYPTDSHQLTAIQYATEALMYAAGTPGFPEAQAWLTTDWEIMITTLGTWGSAADGGFANGGGYGWYASGAMARTLAFSKLIADVDLSQWSAAGLFGYNQIAFSAPAINLRQQFGDEADNRLHYQNYSFDGSRLLANVTRNIDFEWYWRANPANVTYKYALMPMHYLLLGTSSQQPSAPASTPNLPNSFLFEDAGVVAMHSKTTDPLRTSVFFRSSRFGAFNHSHADNNAFTFVSKGKEILISGGIYDDYGSPHHLWATRATRYKNALTFDGGIGQSEPTPVPTAPGAPVISMEARGKILNFDDSGTWALVTGDATLAYRGRDPKTWAWTPLLAGAYRTVAYNRNEKVVVIYDWARSTTPRKWELNFQSVFAPTLTGSTLKIVNDTSNACIDIYGPSGNFALNHQWPIVNGKELAPSPTKQAPEQNQTRFSVNTKSQELTAVTVIREDCRAVPVRVSFMGSLASVSINNATALILDGKVAKTP